MPLSNLFAASTESIMQKMKKYESAGSLSTTDAEASRVRTKIKIRRFQDDDNDESDTASRAPRQKKRRQHTSTPKKNGKKYSYVYVVLLCLIGVHLIDAQSSFPAVTFPVVKSSFPVANASSPFPVANSSFPVNIVPSNTSSIPLLEGERADADVEVHHNCHCRHLERSYNHN
jgi:hypothetical protein